MRVRWGGTYECEYDDGVLPESLDGGRGERSFLSYRKRRRNRSNARCNNKEKLKKKGGVRILRAWGERGGRWGEVKQHYLCIGGRW